jgi:hypothetical protein
VVNATNAAVVARRIRSLLTDTAVFYGYSTVIVAGGELFELIKSTFCFFRLQEYEKEFLVFPSYPNFTEILHDDLGWGIL